MVSIFFSYSHDDEALRDALEKQLAVLKSQGLIDIWHDRCIGAGQERSIEVARHLETADIILLLFSPDFLSAEDYDVEAGCAFKRHNDRKAKVLPVILRPCDWEHTDFSTFLVAPRNKVAITRWPDRDEAFLDVVQVIREAVEELKATSAPHAVPSTGRLSPPEPRSLPRSSNLRLAKTFTDSDRDRFTDQVFEFITKYFENSLDELKRRNPEVDKRFKLIDANAFEASVYVGGTKRITCGIWRNDGGRGGHGYSFGGGILYSTTGVVRNSINESLSVGSDDQSLFIKAMNISSLGGGRDKKMSDEGAAEHLWSLFIGPLQSRA